MTPLKAFRDQLGKLQRLAQPYFLPLDNGASSGQFLLLVVALLAVVVGFTLLLLTAAVAASGAWIPELQARFLPGVPEQVAGIWAGPIGKVVMAAQVSDVFPVGCHPFVVEQTGFGEQEGAGADRCGYLCSGSRCGQPGDDGWFVEFFCNHPAGDDQQINRRM